MKRRRLGKNVERHTRWPVGMGYWSLAQLGTRESVTCHDGVPCRGRSGTVQGAGVGSDGPITSHLEGSGGFLQRLTGAAGPHRCHVCRGCTAHSARRLTRMGWTPLWFSGLTGLYRSVRPPAGPCQRSWATWHLVPGLPEQPWPCNRRHQWVHLRRPRRARGSVAWDSARRRRAVK